MKLLILGGRGMAGHVMVQYFSGKPDVTVFSTSRDPNDPTGLYLDVNEENGVERLFELVRPDVTINCIGLLNEDAARREGEALRVNGLLPHRLRRLADLTGGKLVHISTDCVFSGLRGSYGENDLPDGESAYAKTKAMGEVRQAPHLTVRTSIIGPELKDGIGLFHWFMQQRGTVTGYRRVPWNGVTTLELAKSVERMLEEDIEGLVHLTAPAPISKHDLLLLIQEVFDKRDVTVVPRDEPVLDRTLRNTRCDFHPRVPDYPVMLAELKAWMEAGANGKRS
ncbi:dTDP-4-dehydrorhamnose reductase family protein [Gorillibacterium sp. sgz500922]|uniref:dTDP-4-dehydrorhamnose reductase family protein n=1 Tax=Gorillibacterium sp. sgz500922 TaxID=3446694 RepID=UPI003F67E0B4